MYETVAHTVEIPLAPAARFDLGIGVPGGRSRARLAGAAALARAAASLCNELSSTVTYTPADFTVSHFRNGAPRLSAAHGAANRCPAALLRGLHVSLSHSRTHAVAVAAYSAPSRGRRHER
jgi:hypothetical protein